MKTLLITFALLCVCVTAASAAWIVQIKDQHRSWNSRDTITLVITRNSDWREWKKNNRGITRRHDVRYAAVSRGQRYRRFRDYDWVEYTE